MYSIRKSADTRSRKKNHNTKKNGKVSPQYYEMNHIPKTVNFKNLRMLKELHDDNQYDKHQYRYIYNEEYVTGMSRENFGTDVEYYISNNRIDGIKYELKKGYSPDISFGLNCPCCYYDNPDDLTRCFWYDRFNAFKILLPKTNPELLIDLNGETGVQIWGDRAEPYLRLMSETVDIPANYLLEYIGYVPSFNIKTLRVMLEAMGKSEDSLDFSRIHLSHYSKDYCEYLLKNGKLDVESTFSRVISGIPRSNENKRDALVYLGQLCIRLGADTSKETTFGLNYSTIATELSMPRLSGDEIQNIVLSMKISIDSLVTRINQYLYEDLESSDESDEDSIESYDYMRDTKYRQMIETMESLCEICTGGKHESAMTIQCFFRICRSTKIANDLRLLPENLFEPEFSSTRKKILNIDESPFKC